VTWTPQRVQTRRTYEDAVEQIGFALLAGDLRVGDRLPSERDLAAAMGVSRPTVREAIRALSDVGALKVEAGPGGGIYVESDVVSAAHLRARMDTVVNDVAHVLEARRLLEPHVAQLAGVFATESDFRQLQATIDRHRRVLSHREQANQMDERFHIAMARATGNPVLVGMVRRLLEQYQLAVDMDYRAPADPSRGICAHEETLEALMSRDPAQIDAAMDRHLAILEELWQAQAGRPRLRRWPPVPPAPADILTGEDQGS
jgi:GntR family transcriptional regulator, transcriptional repressor for pyruvate dehydrogenase complex